MNRICLRRIVVVSLAASLLALAGARGAKRPTKPSGPWEFKTQSAARAKAAYDRAAVRAKADYYAEVAAARRALTKALEGALDEATRAKNLDDAVKIRDAIAALKNGDAVEGPGEAGDTPRLAKALVGTRWLISDGVFEFRERDFVFAEGGRVGGTWQVISPQTIRAEMRGHGRRDWTFDPGLNNCMTADADGRALGTAPRVR